MATGHRPVMLEEAVGALRLNADDAVVDATFGGGGHSRRSSSASGPRDASSASTGTRRLPNVPPTSLEDPRFGFVRAPTTWSLWAMVEEGGGSTRSSSISVSRASRSTSRNAGSPTSSEGPLDMRMDPGTGVSAAEYLNDGRSRRVGAGALRVRGRAARRGPQGGAGGRTEQTAGDHDRPVRRSAGGDRLGGEGR